MNDLPVRWSKRALLNLRAITIPIGEDNPRAAMRVTERIWSATEHLSRHPFIGRVGRIENSSELVFSDIPYVIGYRVFEDHIAIIGVIHAARDWPKRL